MEQYNITFKNLSSLGYSNYIITAEGKLFYIPSQKEIKHDNKFRFYIINDKGERKRVYLKHLYRCAYGKEFSVDTIQDLPFEEWRQIPNTKGKYFISNFGRVKSLYGYTAKILKPFVKENGYLIVKIEGKNLMIHRLVAFAFCENKYTDLNIQDLQIHHKDTNRQNNKSSNLSILSFEEHRKEHQKNRAKNEE